MSRAFKIRNHLPSTIRSIQYGDWRSIYRIGQESDQWPRSNADLDPAMQRMMARINTSEHIVVDTEGSIRGYLYWGILKSGNAELISMAIDPAFRRMGLATRLLWRVGSLSKARGFRRVLATVDEHNEDAIAFLRAMGMRGICVKSGWFGDHDGYRFGITLEGDS